MVKVSVMRGISAQIVNRESLNGMILILQNKITSQAQKSVDLFPFKVEIFQVSLQINIDLHGGFDHFGFFLLICHGSAVFVSVCSWLY